MTARFLILMAALRLAVYAADACNPAEFPGAYGFQLAGTTGAGQSAVSVGRLSFDGKGAVSGVASVSFTGLYLGNPVNGTYEARADCSVSWSLQADSGPSQHFDGRWTPAAGRVEFRQTESGIRSGGTLLKSEDSCENYDFQPRYWLDASGKRINVNSGQADGSVFVSGLLENDGGEVTFQPAGQSGAPPAGSVQVDGNCFAHLDLKLPAEGGGTFEMNFRGVLVDGGKALIGMATDPGTAVSLKLSPAAETRSP